jgi:uncharacterized protein (DUF1800 family)
MKRREFLTISKTLQSTVRKSQMGNSNLLTGLNPYAGSFGKPEVTHLLKRTMFGATASDIAYFSGLTIDAAVDELLNNFVVPGPPLRDYGTVDDGINTYDDPGAAIGQTWVNDLNKSVTGLAASQINRLRNDSLSKWWTGIILNQGRSIGEKMLVFWHHHFSVQREEVETATLMYRYHMLLRNNVVGNLRGLTREVTTNPAMLKHLNGYLNSKLAPDENYAREFQELFTIGKGPNSAYTEEDVREAARVLTGWRIEQATLNAYPEESAHDNGTKTFSAFYGNTTISGSTCAQELDQLINMIFSTAESSLYFCRKLYRYFVHSAIDDPTESNVIAPLAQILRNNNFEVKPVLAALLKSEHFYDPENQASYIKSPHDFIIGTMREMAIPVPASTDHVNGYPLFGTVGQQAAAMLQDLFQPPDVSGWPAYYQEPIFYEYWVNSNSLPLRAEFSDRLIDEQLIDCRTLAAGTANPSDPDLLIDNLSAKFLRYPLSAASKQFVKNRFLLADSGDNSLWTTAWNTNDNGTVTPALNKLFKFLMNLPEYHLC